MVVNRTTGRLRAIKVIELERSGPAVREIGSIARFESKPQCRHPNLLAIDHVGKTADHLFYVMDLADDICGGPASDDPGYQPATLRAKLQHGPLERNNCVQCGRQLLAGLAALHAAGMVHRDIKPANCLFVQGTFKLADFGLLTESHPLVSRVGTQSYMPPDGRMDMRADVYAAGLVIYEMLTGRPVDDFPQLGRRAGEIAVDANLSRLLRIVLRACEREPERRYPDARAMLAELDKPVSAPRRMARRRIFIAILAVALAVAGWGVWQLSPERATVNFITNPHEAMVFIDGELQLDSDGEPCRTPCTIAGLPSGEHRVEFEREGVSHWDAGACDFSHTRQIVSRPE
jgi:eukaryotic-like serine/threonine-protein kinase